LLSKFRALLQGGPAGVCLLLAVALVGLLAHFLHTTFGLGGAGLDAVFNNWVYNVVFVAAALVCLCRGVLVTASRGAWRAIGAGLLSWALGDIYWTLFFSNSETVPYPSPADALYLSAYLALSAGIVMLLRPRLPRFQTSLWMDGLIGALAAAAVGAAFLYPAIKEATTGSTAAIVTNLMYPLNDLVLLALLVGGLALTGWRPGRKFALIAAGLTVLVIADSVFLYQSATGSYKEGTWLDSLWLASALAVAAAAWSPRSRPAAAPLEGLRLVAMPTLFAVVALGVAAYGEFGPLNRLAGVLAIAALAVVIVRFVLTFHANEKLVEAVTYEAMTDQLTQLGNRRRLIRDLTAVIDHPNGRPSHVLAIFDLDGFKNYNDSFGHPAGDRLLVRMSATLSATMSDLGGAYRLGGDEFCVLAPTTHESPGLIVARAMLALSAEGEGFKIEASSGYVRIPEETDDALSALRLADERLYREKSRHPSSAKNQIRDVLLNVLHEREPQLTEGVLGAGQLAHSLGRIAGLDEKELDVAVRAAELHEIGKAAIPDEVLLKPGPLSELEWELMSKYTVIGERMLDGVPALQPVGRVIRATGERWDGSGYPDGLSGEEIPLAARVVSICAAFHAMTSTRPHRSRLDVQDALEELRRRAGSQFDPNLIDDFCGWVFPTAGKAPVSHRRERLREPS
jgi:two-component system, cell cycle response regulator